MRRNSHFLQNWWLSVVKNEHRRRIALERVVNLLLIAAVAAPDQGDPRLRRKRIAADRLQGHGTRVVGGAVDALHVHQQPWRGRDVALAELSQLGRFFRAPCAQE